MKQSTTKSYLGIDVSKSWFNVCLMQVIDHQKQPMQSAEFGNNAKGIKQFAQWLKKEDATDPATTLIVIENTGVYHRLIWKFCSDRQLPLYIGNAAHIKWSLGITRGKSDRVDSERLCIYAVKEHDDLKLTAGLDIVFMQLKDLMTARTKLIGQLRSMEVYLKELKLSNEPTVQQVLEKAHKIALDGLKKSIRLLEQQIQLIVDNNQAIKTNYQLLVSVPGVGHITALYLICCTNNFAGKISGKQLASYAGVVPFEHSSGSSIRGKNRVHKMANKELKKLLYLCAMATIQHYAEFRDYYDRKLSEGKHTMIVLNAIKNKIVLRAAAVINNRQPYVDKYTKAA
jgi:transposase